MSISNPDLSVYPYIHSKITKNTFVTGWAGSLNRSLLKANNIKTIICLNNELHKSRQIMHMYNELGIVHHYIVLDDIPSADIKLHFDRIFNIVTERLQYGAVLFHCTMGISRSITALISVILRKSLHKHPNVNTNTILKYVKKRRPCANPNPGFYDQLIKYENTLRGLV